MHKVTRLASAGRSADYYGKDDYYVSGEADAPGLVWGGRGAEALDLEGRVDPKAFRSLLQGVNPNEGGPAVSKLERLVDAGMSAEQAEKAAPHAPGWDQTFSAPKSFSLADLVGGDERLAVAHGEAVEAAMQYAEEHFSLYRTREEDGSRREVIAGNLTYAVVEHGLSRECDPQRHSHVVVMNMVQDREGQWRALETKDIYRYSQLLGLVYQGALRERVHELGYDTVDGKTPGTFELKGFDETQLKAFSKRASVLEQKFEAQSQEKGRALLGQEKQTLRKIDRPDKLGLPREQVREGWLAEAKSVGLDIVRIVERARQREASKVLGQHKGAEIEGQASAFISKVWSIVDRTEKAFGTAKAAVGHAIGLQEERTAVFRSHDVVFRAMKVSNNAFTLPDYLKGLSVAQRAGQLVPADKVLNGGLTTSRSLEIETGLVDALSRGIGGRGAGYPPEEIDKRLTSVGLDEIGARVTPNRSQAEVVRSVLASENRIDLVQGYAGVGKTTTLDLLGKALSSLSDGEVQLKGLAPTHKAAQAMESEAGIKAQTVAGFLGRFHRDQARHDLSDLKAEYGGHWLVLDEASQLGNKAMSDLVAATERLGITKLIITGDQRQLSSPAAGAPLRLLQIESEKMGAPRVELDTIIRQSDDTLRSAIYDLADGKTNAALGKLLPNIREVERESGAVVDDRAFVMTGIEAWKALKADKAPDQPAPRIVVPTNALRHLASEAIREERILAGEVSAQGYRQEVFVAKNLSESEKRASRSYEVGQRLSFFAASRALGVGRQAEYEVTGLDHANNRLIAKGAGGKTLTFRLDDTLKGQKLPFAVYDRQQIEIAAGDRLLWQASDPKRGIATNREFDVLDVKSGYLRIRDEEGREQSISKTDPMLKHATYAYALTADRAQGQTYPDVVAILSSRHSEVANKARAYVMASRPKDGLVLVTDDAKSLFRSLAEHDGMNRIALQHVGNEIELKMQKLKGIDQTQTLSQTKALADRNLGNDHHAPLPALTEGTERDKAWDNKEKEIALPPLEVVLVRQRNYDIGM